MSSTSFCQKAPKITLQLPHRLHLDDTREHLKGEVQLAEKGSKPTSGTLPFRMASHHPAASTPLGSWNLKQ